MQQNSIYITSHRHFYKQLYADTKWQHKDYSSYPLLVLEMLFVFWRTSAVVPTSSVCLYVQRHQGIQPGPEVLEDLDKNPL